ncbi:hypothetical protein [Mesonia sp. K7]|uniref:hypothetical protein n=1 Tax=Mesonia sp. K7 TaxID=2218606 RepID=UPI000DA90A82|nr:hypothetical protein [Mesonia sp. K7]PZD78470.1 hypothetical protein DNG35_05250 [Mesonia sp. K7]
MKKITLLSILVFSFLGAQAYNIEKEKNKETKDPNNCSTIYINAVADNNTSKVTFYADTQLSSNTEILSSTFEVTYKNGYKVNYFGKLDELTGEPEVTLNLDGSTNASIVESIKVTVYTAHGSGNDCNITEISDWKTGGGIWADNIENHINIAQHD